MGIEQRGPRSNGAEGGLPFDGDQVIEQLGAQVGHLTAQLAIRESVIEKLRGELAKAQGKVPAMKEA